MTYTNISIRTLISNEQHDILDMVLEYTYKTTTAKIEHAREQNLEISYLLNLQKNNGTLRIRSQN